MMYRSYKQQMVQLYFYRVSLQMTQMCYNMYINYFLGKAYAAQIFSTSALLRTVQTSLLFVEA